MPRPARRTRKHARRASPAAGSRALAAREREARGFDALLSRESSPATKINLIRSGVVARVVNDMVEYLDVPKAVVFKVLHTPESTAHKLIRDNRTLDAATTERVVRVAEVARLAEATLGGRHAAAAWLRTTNHALGGTTPLSLLDTEPGANEVRRILAAIDHGGPL
jgi:putative toxin-antitoxin system antitoxin component (TIGR02293 family)